MNFVQRLTDALKPENRRGGFEVVHVRAADLRDLLHHFKRLDDAAQAEHDRDLTLQPWPGGKS